MMIFMRFIHSEKISREDVGNVTTISMLQLLLSKSPIRLDNFKHQTVSARSPSFPSHLATFPTKVAMLYRYTCPQVFFQVLHLGSSKTTRKGNLLILMVSGFQRIQLLSENNEPFVYHAHLLLLSFWCNRFWDGDF